MSIEQRVDILVRDARQKSGHQVYSAQTGISQREFVEYLNDAQDHIYNLILQERSTLYRKKGTLTVTAGTAEYTLPADGYLKHNINYVRYSPTGSAQDYYTLNLRTSREQLSFSGLPDSYMLRDGTLIVSPIPSQGGVLQLEYQYVLPTLDIRRAQPFFISPGVGNQSIILTDVLISESTYDLSNGMVDYVCIVDKDGAALQSNLPVVSYDSTTRELLVNPPTSLSVDGTGTGYVVFGYSATTHSALPQICKRYLVEYATMRAQTRDSNSEAMMTAPLLQMLEREILDSIANLEEDNMSVPILDSQWLGEYDEDQIG